MHFLIRLSCYASVQRAHLNCFPKAFAFHDQRDFDPENPVIPSKEVAFDGFCPFSCHGCPGKSPVVKKRPAQRSSLHYGISFVKCSMGQIMNPPCCISRFNSLQAAVFRTIESHTSCHKILQLMCRRVAIVKSVNMVFGARKNNNPIPLNLSQLF
jgi:hypothetical protein